MLTAAVDSPALPVGFAAEPKWDGFRAQLVVHACGRVLLRSRQGTDMIGSFPEIRAAALAQPADDVGLDGELVVWESGRLAFERRQQRLVRRGKGAGEAARQWPAHYVPFDLLHQGGTDVTGWSYRRRRAALEVLFAERGLRALFTLCPSTTDPAVAGQWLGWASAGMEGLCFKRLDEPYRPLRSWRKYKVRVTTEAIVGAITGSPAAPRTVLLGRYDRAGRLQYIGHRSTTLSQAAGRALAELLTPAVSVHPWEGWTFSAGWGTQRTLDVHLVQPDIVMEVAVDVARDAAGRWRHPARAHRVRTDIAVAQVPHFGE
ncbi:ATP-dependent DNA ligase [Streptomyces neyagawaensis]|uniref:ATP-dependent DNA ligase n=1 Tax=Streptomyces neyagawaensis TaxID=42238 RepID=UPI0006E1B515|nr:ATP-dependent DNA ligase [Streptomyces neyagawaensis]MCL6735091.1 ATP-dependent DNA ligase [Streptomyces neyagawaensis]MDE1687486.1 ATP-dependent DNA ligase [Streptomyces neyagawaensis]